MFPLYLAMICLGLAAGFVLYAKIPRLGPAPEQRRTISIIIPVRNEQHNIANLLQDLQAQTRPVQQILCVDDGSTDGTAARIGAFEGVDYLPITQKPDDWMGKTYACQQGGQAATGELLVFIDADVRLGPSTVEQIAAQCQNCLVSVQPYHTVTRFFEHFAFFFNLVGVAANGAACPLAPQKAGLFGPVIALSKMDFLRIGGYEKVKASVIEDVELGRVLQQEGVPFRLFVGDGTLSFRMYQNFGELFRGFVKNYSSGAARTPVRLLLLTFLWITALTAVPLSLALGQMPVLFVPLYALFCAQLWWLSPKIGSFRKLLLLVYPVFLLAFHLIFLYSLCAKWIFKKVTWKGREISLQ